MPKIDSDLIPYLILNGMIMAATGALQMWVVTSLLWQG
ncbi:MAG: hypothetical protein ACI87E_003379 [Mariniblastus sp.]|jgi:hypothetical protein